MSVRTRLTELLGIEHPVMLAGMGGVSYHRLTSAVSEAGGFGCLGASVMTKREMVDEIGKVRAATDKPFGVDLLTAMPADMETQVELLIEGGAKVFVAGLGVPTGVVDLCHRHGVLVANMCGKVDHARKAVDAGCDIVIAQGTEGGGHTGTVATFPLVPLIADAVGDRVTVVAAGGIFDGRGLAAALALGADGIWMGTRFIATPEAQGVRGFKEALVNTREDGTVISRAYSGKTMRVIRNRYTDEWEAKADQLERFPAQALNAINAGVFHLGGDEATPDVRPEVECYPAGQAAGGIESVTPAAEIVAQVVAEAEQVLARMGEPLRAPTAGEQPVEPGRSEPRVPLLEHAEAIGRAAEHDLPEALADLNIFRALLHNPPLSKWFVEILMGLLWRTELDHRLRELVIMRLGWVTNSDYEWTQHWRIAGDLGVPEEDLLGVRDWQNHRCFSEADRAVLAATDDVVTRGFISASVWEACVENVSEDPRVLLELVSAIGMWRMVSTMLRSMQVPLEDGVDSWPPAGVAPGPQVLSAS